MSIIIMILLISLLILVHEAGHFLVAKMFRMKVSKFAFGLPIGPTLWSKKFGDLEVLVHAFLLGGYVAFPDDDKELNLPQDSPDRFMNKPIYQRFFVVSAGVFANIVCAFLLVVLTACIWGQMPSGKYDVYVKNIIAPKEESIWKSGIQAGDKIVSINGSKITNPNALVTYVKLSKSNGGKVFLEEVEDNYKSIKAINPAFTREEIIHEDIIIKLPTRESEKEFVLNNNILIGLEKYKDKRVELSDAQKAIRDKMAGKSILVSDGTYTLDDIAYAYTDGLCPINMTVLRENEEIELKPIYPNSEGTIGIAMDIKEVNIPTKNFTSVIKTSSKFLWTQATLLTYGLYQIFTGKIPVSELHGIIAITKVGGDVIHSSGIFSGLLLTAIISIDLAIINFLPIPALDGGHVMFLIIEKIRGKKVEEETIEKFSTFFFMLLIVLMILVCVNDVYALLVHKF